VGKLQRHQADGEAGRCALPLPEGVEAVVERAVGRALTAKRPAQDRLVEKEEAAELLGVTTRTLFKMMSAGEFVEPVDLGMRSLRWRLSDIEKWITELPPAGGNHR